MYSLSNTCGIGRTVNMGWVTWLLIVKFCCGLTENWQQSVTVYHPLLQNYEKI